MFRYRKTIVPAFAFALALVPLSAPRISAVQTPAPASPPAVVPVEVVALDRDGKAVDNLGPGSFAVTVDGRPRRVLWVRHVSRGPGASSDAASRQVNRSETLSFAAEPARNILVVVDEASIVRGAERAVTQAAGALLDRLGLDDRVGVVRIPMPRDSRVALTAERPEARAALRQVVGQAVQAGGSANDALQAQQQAQAADQNRTQTVDPDRAATAERTPPPVAADMPAKAADEDPDARGIVPGLQTLLKALQPFPGRKVVALFSAGLPAAGTSRLDDVALAAAGAHAVIYGFGVQGARDDPSGTLDPTALERLANLTGGSFTMIGRNADRSVERVVSELSACYVLGVEGAPSDADGRRHALRVEVPRQPLTLRAPAWLMPKDDVDDVVPRAPGPGASPAPVTPPASPSPSSPRPAPGAPETRSVASSPRDPEVEHLLARVADYVAGYQREYSALVAEEYYIQSSRGIRRQLRSDLLLVRPPNQDGWISFRDVFEVDGFPVRDREDRLKRLFLDPSVEAQAQLKAIKDESARYNIGQVERNINLPLYALKFLQPEHLGRSRFKLAGKHDVSGVEALRIECEEQVRPTLTRFSQNDDLPAKGWFLVDPVTGAVVGSSLDLEFLTGRGRVHFEVRYQRDSSLGLWVPAEMKETYEVRGPVFDWIQSLDARATYSKFRRFQVRTEEQIKIIK
jgi:VWFA-related protein